MLKFDFSITNKDGYLLRKTIEEYGENMPDILELNGDFGIYIDGELFFYQPEFPVLEFILYVTNWICDNKYYSDMNYNSIETEDNPLIEFELKNGSWIIKSPWQLKSSHKKFNKDEIISAFNTLVTDVQSQLTYQSSRNDDPFGTQAQ